eukprot:512596-Amphidinium_carterae.1
MAAWVTQAAAAPWPTLSSEPVVRSSCWLDIVSTVNSVPVVSKESGAERKQQRVEQKEYEVMVLKHFRTFEVFKLCCHSIQKYSQLSSSGELL